MEKQKTSRLPTEISFVFFKFYFTIFIHFLSHDSTDSEILKATSGRYFKFRARDQRTLSTREDIHEFVLCRPQEKKLGLTNFSLVITPFTRGLYPNSGKLRLLLENLIQFIETFSKKYWPRVQIFCLVIDGAALIYYTLLSPLPANWTFQKFQRSVWLLFFDASKDFHKQNLITEKMITSKKETWSKGSELGAGPNAPFEILTIFLTISWNKETIFGFLTNML